MLFLLIPSRCTAPASLVRRTRLLSAVTMWLLVVSRLRLNRRPTVICVVRVGGSLCELKVTGNMLCTSVTWCCVRLRCDSVQTGIRSWKCDS